MNITVLHNQSLLDIAIMYTGSVLSAFDISVANNMALTDDLVLGTVLIIPESLDKDMDVYNYLRSKQAQPATAITIRPGTEPELEGVGYWAIEKNFKIN